MGSGASRPKRKSADSNAATDSSDSAAAASVLLPPPAFAQLGSTLLKSEIEACLVALVLRKGVLALAMDSFSTLEPDAAGGYNTAAWWEALSERSRVVVESKIRLAGTPDVLFALALECRGISEMATPVASATTADMRSTLGDVDPSLDLDGLLEGCGAELNIKSWLSGLPAAVREQLTHTLADDDGSSPPAMHATPTSAPPGVHTVSPD